MRSIRLRAAAEKVSAGAVLGIGGGKTLIPPSAGAFYERPGVAIAPTIAFLPTHRAAHSRLFIPMPVSFDRYLLLPHNPNIWSLSIAQIGGRAGASVTAGIGDALATRFEARACPTRSGATTMAGGKCTQVALALAELCWQHADRRRRKAMLAAERGVTPALERVIEANTYLKAGRRKRRFIAAHAIY